MTTRARTYQTLRVDVAAIGAWVEELAALDELDRVNVYRLEQMATQAREIIASSGRMMRGLEGESGEAS